MTISVDLTLSLLASSLFQFLIELAIKTWKSYLKGAFSNVAFD